MKTQVDLINRVLGLLGVIETGQEPAAEDVELVQGHISGKFDELGRRQVYYVQDPNAIDDEFFLPLAKIVANAAAPEFGQAHDPEVDAREEWRLRDIDRAPRSYGPLRTEYL